ncbi:hypothetical protein O3G_MSEX015501 [Manduca sexta]|uniref:Gag-like protein n=1 Tax=Manduca sexta TaxID=7130 RepID=A0A922D240_MANSE|nr:hypothetical protein O3G_MSEX015501 [Manduca sexta]
MPPKAEPRKLIHTAEHCNNISNFSSIIPKFCHCILDALREGKSVTSVNKDYIEDNTREIMKAAQHINTLLMKFDVTSVEKYFSPVFSKVETLKQLATGSPLPLSTLLKPPPASKEQPFDVNSIKKDIVESMQSVLEKHIQTINEQTDRQNKAIEEIKNQLSRPTTTPAPKPTQPRTYGAVAATPATTDSNRPISTRPKPTVIASKARPAIIITPTNTVKTQTAEEVIKLFKKNISFRDSEYAPARVQAISKNKLRIEFDRTEERDDALSRLQKASDVRAEPARHLKPMVMLKGISLDTPVEQLTEIILKQNPNISSLVKDGAVFQYRLSRDNRNPNFYNAAFITDPAVWRRITEAGRVCVDYQRVHAEDFSPFIQCFRCLQFGHTRAKCEAPDTICAHCASSKHCTVKCPTLEGPAKCYNCTTYNKRFNNNTDASHRATSSSCPRIKSMRERILNRVDYGSP